ncbi:hypothetical protein POTOM_012828 [Populus tomentosa]|uniref:Uncharacterized protein n=1 Tax=Populus tomentosa TaxID=118781 RepID=A0A8X8D120_POPTO|nr:hypothetical protein POTOM_012828 [Populus tomentosa]
MNNISFLCWVTVTMERNLNLVYIVVGLVIALFSVLEKERPPQKELNGIEWNTETMRRRLRSCHCKIWWFTDLMTPLVPTEDAPHVLFNFVSGNPVMAMDDGVLKAFKYFYEELETCMKNQIRAACGVRQPCMKIRQKPGFDAHQMIRLYSLSSQVSTASADTLLLFVNYTINYENIYYTNNSELLVIWMDMFLFYRINPP